MKNRNKYLAEVIGTYALVFFCTGCGIVNQDYGGVIGLPGISLICGLIVLAMIYAFGDISGAHINPAVSIAFVVAGRMKKQDLPGYILSQFAGGILASFSLKMLFPKNQGLSGTHPAGSELQAFILECILSFFLMLVILRVSTGEKEKGITAGIAIAAVVCLEVLFAGAVSGASMNPIRSLAPAIATGNYTGIWIYLSAPVLGAIGGVFAFKAVSPETKEF
jgi:aquaporin NIP